jgi:hypothetical protein
MSEADLRDFLAERQAAVTARLSSYQAERKRLTDLGCLRPASLAVLRHLELRLEAELAWRTELDKVLAPIVAASANPGNLAPPARQGGTRTNPTKG